jgi:DNA-binding SARP family transcriptional activator/tetratricopeptide (TPR) repeat protein
LEGRAEQQHTKIRLCGPMVVEIEGRPITPPGRQGRMVFAYQVANRSRHLRRDELLGVLWEGKPPSDPDGGLNTVISRLRTELGNEVLPPHEISLRLPENAWVDVELIEERAQQTLQALKDGRSAEAAELASEALNLLEGQLLPGLEARWIDERRRELDELGLSLLRASVEARLQLGGEELDPAERAARRLVERAPYRESGHKLLMEVLAARGDVAEAHLVYDRLKRLLMDELGKTPDTAITELNAQLLEGATPEVGARAPMAAARTPPHGVPLPPLLYALRDQRFVGRDQAIARLCLRWEQVSINPRVAVLTGEPGIGKTRLAACFSHRVHRDRGTVLYGRCYEDPLTYQPFVEALGHYAGAHDLPHELPDVAEQLWHYLPALHQVLHGVDPRDRSPGPQDRYALFEAVAAVLRHAAEARPLLLVIDDLHWADAATFELLLHSVGSVPPSRFMVLVTARDAADPRASRSDGQPESLDARLGALRHEADVEHVFMEGLDEEETAKLIRVHSEVARSEDFAHRMWRRTRGNPLFIEEMLPLVGDEEEPDLSRLGVPEAVEQAIATRLEHLRDGSRKVLARASVIGPEFTLSLLAAVLGESEDGTLAEVEELIRYGLVVEVPDKPDHFAFSHALVRETQYWSLIASRRTRIHMQIAQELEHRASPSGGGQRVPPAELAHHFYEARPAVDPQHAAQHSINAAKDAELSAAYQQASTQYDRAIELLGAAGADESQICELLIAKGKADLRAGRLERARDTFRDAAAIARRTGEAEQLAHAALGFHGRYTAAAEVHRERIKLLEEALDALDPADGALRARVLARLGDSLLWSAGDRGRELSTEAVRMAAPLGNATATLEALAAKHTALLHIEHLDDRLELSTKRLEIARETGSDETIAAALRWCIHDLCEQGDMRSAKKLYAELGQRADRLSQPLYLSYARHWECVFAQLHGRLEEAERLADDAFDLATRAGAADAEMSRVDKRSAIYREQRRLNTLRPAIERFAREVPEIKAWWALLALVEAETGHPAAARAQVDRLLADDAAALPSDVFWLYAMALLAETCALLEDASEPASVVYRLLRPYAERHVQVGIDTFMGSTSRYLGLAATTCGEWEAAEVHFRFAEERHEEMDSLPLLARTHLNHAAMLFRRGDETEVSKLLDKVDEIAGKSDLADVRTRAKALRARIAATAAHA